MKDKKQSMRISDAEMELLKSTFSDRDDLLKSIRNVFFGIATDEDKKIVKDTFSTNKVLQKLMRKQFLPEIQADLPLGQCIDLWMTIDLKDKNSEEIIWLVRGRMKLIEMIESSLKMLEDVNNIPVDLAEWCKNDLVNDSALIARNQFISHIDQQLKTIEILAGLKSETVEETKKRLLQNSNK